MRPNTRFSRSARRLADVASRGVVTATLLFASLSAVWAGPCRYDSWQPTFVHDLRAGFYPGPFYVLPGGGFRVLRNVNGSYVGDACDLINQFGVRDPLGYTDCQNYTRVQCGCDDRSRVNRTCAAFLASRQAMGPEATVIGIVTNDRRDLVGNNESFRGNGVADVVFQVRLNGREQVITGIEVRNLNGTYSVWDSQPGNGMWLGVARLAGNTISRADGSISYRTPPGDAVLEFLCEDNGSVRGSNTSYRMTISFANGSRVTVDFQR